MPLYIFNLNKVNILLIFGNFNNLQIIILLLINLNLQRLNNLYIFINFLQTLVKNFHLPLHRYFNIAQYKMNWTRLILQKANLFIYFLIKYITTVKNLLEFVLFSLLNTVQTTIFLLNKLKLFNVEEEENIKRMLICVEIFV